MQIKTADEELMSTINSLSSCFADYLEKYAPQHQAFLNEQEPLEIKVALQLRALEYLIHHKKPSFPDSRGAS